MKAKSVPTMAIVMILATPGFVFFARGQAPQILVKAKRVYTASAAGVIEDGQVLIEGGKIKAVGTDVPAGPDARVYTAESVIPGLIDAHAHVALNRGQRARPSPPIANSADARTVDQFRFDDPVLRKIVEGGVTTLLVRGGGPGRVFRGQCLAVKLKDAPRDEMILKEYADMKMYVRAGVGGPFYTLMGWHSVARREFVKAQDYMQRWADYEQGKLKQRPEADPKMEALAVLLRRESPIHVHTNYPAEMLMVLDMAKEFNLRLTLGHANYAHRVARQIKEANAIPVVGPTFIVQRYDEDHPQNVPALLAEAGVDVSLQMDMSGQHNKVFLEVGSLLIRHGMREDHALRALTINGAKAMLMDDRIGSLEPGKDADLALLDGPPFELTSYVTHTFIDGNLEFELKERPQAAKLTELPPFKKFVNRARPGADKIAIVNGTLFPMTGQGVVRGGTVLVEAGRIGEVGSGIDVPSGYQVVDAGGRVVMPGMVAARAYPADAVVPWWGNTRTDFLADEPSHPMTPDIDPRYNIDPTMPNWKVMRELGLTTYLITPGNTNLIGGKGIVLRGIGSTYTEMLRDPEPKAMVFSIGEGPRRQWGNDHFDGGGILTMIRESLDRAKAYRANRAQGKRQPRDLKSEALIPVLERKLLAIIYADREEEIRAAIQLGDDYGLRMAISGGVEAHRVIPELKQRDIPVILGKSGVGWTSFENIRAVRGADFDEQMPAKLERAGIKVALFGPGGHRGSLPIGRIGGEPALNAAWCFKNGMSEAAALRMITINSAEVAGMGDQLGSLEKGKVADIVIVNGHPLEYRALPEMVLIDGKVVYERGPSPY